MHSKARTPKDLHQDNPPAMRSRGADVCSGVWEVKKMWFEGRGVFATIEVATREPATERGTKRKTNKVPESYKTIHDPKLGHSTTLGHRPTLKEP
eukprot:366351-Chlamydomonas_euryale.AAC.3